MRRITSSRGATVGGLRRVVSFGLVAVVVVLSLAVGASVQAHGSGALAERLHERQVAQAAVVEAESDAGRAARAFERAFTGVDPGDSLARRMETLTTVVARRDASWKRYRTLAVGLPGERRSQGRVEQELGLVGKLALDLGAKVSSVVGTDRAEARLVAIAAWNEAAERAATQFAVLRHEYQRAIDRDAADLRARSVRQGQEALAAAVALIGMITVFFGVLGRGLLLQQRTIRAAEAVRARDLARAVLESKLRRGLELVSSEDHACRTIGRAASEALSTTSVDLLLADSSQAHFRHLEEKAEPGCSCPVTSPMDCPATRRSQTQVFSSTRVIDACPVFVDSAGAGSAAVCVPVSVGGTTVGVIHSRAEGALASPDVVDELEMVARIGGDRLSLLRAFARSETQARIDPLTGLLNRRSLESELARLSSVDDGHAVVFADIDHFKLLNDVHGHDAGDRALRIFSSTLRSTVRPEDLTARQGGEEFLVVLPGCSTVDAVEAMERFRSRLAAELASGTVPPFTVSFGVAHFDVHEDFHEAVQAADAALLEAKASGRDRIVLAEPGVRSR